VGKTALGFIWTDLVTPPPQGTANGIVDCVHKTAGPVELFGLWLTCHTKKRKRPAVVCHTGLKAQRCGKGLQHIS
jgi:hypothetical protein